jgi:hypothetical protein
VGVEKSWGARAVRLHRTMTSAPTWSLLPATGIELSALAPLCGPEREFRTGWRRGRGIEEGTNDY